MLLELAIICLLLIEIYITLRGLQTISEEIEDRIVELDTTLAEAIAKIIQGAGNFEPINPIQAAFANLIQNYAQDSPAGSLVEVSRGGDGTFLKKE